MNKENITVSMPITEYEDLIEMRDFWQAKYNSIRKVILKHAECKDGYYEVNNSALLIDIEDYLNSEDYEE